MLNYETKDENYRYKDVKVDVQMYEDSHDKNEDIRQKIGAAPIKRKLWKTRLK